jgi:hypothetical protein
VQRRVETATLRELHRRPGLVGARCMISLFLRSWPERNPGLQRSNVSEEGRQNMQTTDKSDAGGTEDRLAHPSSLSGKRTRKTGELP